MAARCNYGRRGQRPTTLHIPHNSHPHEDCHCSSDCCEKREVSRHYGAWTSFSYLHRRLQCTHRIPRLRDGDTGRQMVTQVGRRLILLLNSFISCCHAFCSNILSILADTEVDDRHIGIIHAA